jgi:1-acyl-sn-glycerol-3-phosphate acyltransferase
VRRRPIRDLLLILSHVVIVRPVLAVLGVRYRRRNLVPRGPCLVVANHNSHLDASVLLTLFPISRVPRVHPVAAADYFGKSWLLRTLSMFLMNAITIERKATLAGDPLGSVKDAIRDGESLIFFPEGSRGEAGVVGPFRAGIGRIVREFPGLQVVPVFLSGPERIWPRGQVVPVPLSIDANVGKPRAYPHELDAAEIAERVRRDVLALAPPPPPLPGPRPAPPFRVAVCGVDPDLRREAFTRILERLGRIDQAVGISDPLLEADPRGVREMVRGIAVARSGAWLSVAAWLLRTGGRLKGSKFAEMVERARIDAAFDHGRVARFLVGNGNALVDVLAWAEAEFYNGQFDERGMQQLVQYLTGKRRIPVRQWWRFLRRAPEVWLLNQLDLVRPPVPDVIVLLKTPPADAMALIRARGEEFQRHQNEAFIAKLQEAYNEVARVLQKRNRVEVLEFDTAVTNADAIADALDDLCRDRLPQPDVTGGVNP